MIKPEIDVKRETKPVNIEANEEIIDVKEKPNRSTPGSIETNEERIDVKEKPNRSTSGSIEAN